MKIAITSQGPDLGSDLDPRFGRAKCFIVYDTETREMSVADNRQNLQSAQGAGIQAGRTVVELGVDAVLTGHVGPKAFVTLQAGGVDVYTSPKGSVREAIERFESGQLQAQESADVEGHWV